MIRPCSTVSLPSRWLVLALGIVLGLGLGPLTIAHGQEPEQPESTEPQEEETKAEPIFPDKALEAAVRRYVFEKRYNDEPIVAEDVRTLSTIKARGKGITSLEGLQYCFSLAELDVSENTITDITPLRDLLQLQSLDLHQNRVQDVATLATLPALQYLELSDNAVVDIAPLKGLTNLNSLYLTDNAIATLEPVRDLKKLWSLYVGGNRIDDLTPLAGLTRLNNLELSDNRIVDLSPLTEMNQLSFLFLQNNRIEDLAPLVAMGRKDYEGQKRFVLFWKVYLAGNPLSDQAQSEQIPELKELGTRLFLDDEGK